MLTTLFSVCAVLGGTLLLCQFVLTLVGMGDHHDMPHDGSADFSGGDVGHDFSHDVGHDAAHGHAGTGHDAQHGHSHAASFFRIVSFRTAVAAITFFGLSGMASSTSGLAPSESVGIAAVTGLAAMWGVHWLMQQLSRMRADGTVHIEQAIGKQGTVYLTIPARLHGAGKIQINVQERTMEFDALTLQDEIPTGEAIVVSGIRGPDTVEVERVGTK